MRKLKFIDSWHYDQYRGTPNMKNFLFKDENDKRCNAYYTKGLISFYDNLNNYMEIQYGFKNIFDNSVSLETVKEWLYTKEFIVEGYEKIKSDYGQW